MCDTVSKVGSVVFRERVIPGVDGGKPFLMMETQVTQALYEAVMGKNPSCFRGAERPVEQVSWFDATRFCNALSELEGLPPAYHISSHAWPEVAFLHESTGYRLPTEAEWRQKRHDVGGGGGSVWSETPWGWGSNAILLGGEYAGFTRKNHAYPRLGIVAVRNC
jgi:formylglycine-generating enzyme required for sulfatase activity